MHNILFYCVLEFIWESNQKQIGLFTHSFSGKVKYHSDGTDIQVHLAQHHPQITVVKEKKI